MKYHLNLSRSQQDTLLAVLLISLAEAATNSVLHEILKNFKPNPPFTRVVQFKELEEGGPGSLTYLRSELGSRNGSCC
jgi:hypothetical protein